MASITQDDVLFILKLLDESPFDELRIEYGDFKLLARKQGKGIGWQALASEDKRPEAPPPIEPTFVEAKDQDWSATKYTESNFEATRGKQISKLSTTDNELIPIPSPMLGTFYRTPKPGTPPFVEVGTFVEEDDPVCIIEVMKLFNTVRAGVRGRIARICAEQGQMVEFKQTLFLVEKPNGKDPSKGQNG